MIASVLEVVSAVTPTNVVGPTAGVFVAVFVAVWIAIRSRRRRR